MSQLSNDYVICQSSSGIQQIRAERTFFKENDRMSLHNGDHILEVINRCEVGRALA
jgi:hypothetical protein